jgi:DNA polymerase-3 subunit gamma/tau
VGSAVGTSTTYADAEPPFDEEPPPFDDDVPDVDAPDVEPTGWATAAPAEPAPWEQSEPTAGAPGTTATAGAGAGQRQAKTDNTPSSQPRTGATAANAARSGARPPAFEEKQRYGESVVREILGATFLEEQPHVSAPRSRGE